MDEQEIQLKARELALAEREMSLKERNDNEKKSAEKQRMIFSSPLLVAIVSALCGTALGAGIQGYSNFNVERNKSEATMHLERMRFEFSLVQGAFEGIDRQESAKQLEFIANSGVITHLDIEQLRSLANTPDDIPIIRRSATSRFAPDSAGVVVGSSDGARKNIRSGNSTGSQILYEVEPGTRVAVISQATDSNGYTWYEVVVGEGEQVGWMASHLIQLDPTTNRGDGNR